MFCTLTEEGCYDRAVCVCVCVWEGGWVDWRGSFLAWFLWRLNLGQSLPLSDWTRQTEGENLCTTVTHTHTVTHSHSNSQTLTHQYNRETIHIRTPDSHFCIPGNCNPLINWCRGPYTHHNYPLQMKRCCVIRRLACSDYAHTIKVEKPLSVPIRIWTSAVDDLCILE